MSETETLEAALERRAETKPQTTIRELVERMRPELVKALQDDGAAQRLMRFYLTAVRLNPKLYECTPESLLAGLLLSAQVGLEPGPLGHVYLVPYKHECTWVLGYTGILELARRSERAGAFRSRVVWDCDEAKVWEDEKGEHYSYTAGPEDKRKAMQYVIVSWKERLGASWVPRVAKVERSRIERAKKAFPAAQKGSGPWVTDEAAMWAKTGIRAVRAWLPLSPEAAYAFAADEARVYDVQTNEDGAAEPVIEAVPDE